MKAKGRVFFFSSGRSIVVGIAFKESFPKSSPPPPTLKHAKKIYATGSLLFLSDRPLVRSFLVSLIIEQTFESFFLFLKQKCFACFDSTFLLI